MYVRISADISGWEPRGPRSAAVPHCLAPFDLKCERTPETQHRIASHTRHALPFKSDPKKRNSLSAQLTDVTFVIPRHKADFERSHNPSLYNYPF